jgi:hypothetical protein
VTVRVIGGIEARVTGENYQNVTSRLTETLRVSNRNHSYTSQFVLVIAILMTQLVFLSSAIVSILFKLICFFLRENCLAFALNKTSPFLTAVKPWANT